MSGAFGSSQWMYATGALAEGSSLRFEDGDSAYLSWTPASAGNRKTWTWSGWVKRGNIGSTQNFFAAGDGTVTNRVGIDFLSDNRLAMGFRDGGDAIVSSAVFRDPSAWYHIVASVDTTDATASNRMKLYVNGEQITSLDTANYPSLNYDTFVNATNLHVVGARYRTSVDLYYDGYLANVCFIDGTVLTPTSFGEYEDTLWKPKPDTDIQALTFGTNGFYLPFDQTTEAEGFSTVTYTGNGGTQSIEGVGFEPDLVWIKSRSGTYGAYNHTLWDAVRGAGANKELTPSQTYAEGGANTSLYGYVSTLDDNGFTLSAGSTNSTQVNGSSTNYVAWCWDAGTGSAASNTDGSITSSVKANTTNGFSIATYTGNGTAGATFGHGLGVAPDMVIVKRRDGTNSWQVYVSDLGATKFLELHSTGAEQTATNRWNDTAPSSSVVTLGDNSNVNSNGGTCVAYSFASVSGYSSIGSFSGTGATGNKITTGFKPAFVMVKSYDQTRNWIIWDNTRTPTNPADGHLHPNANVAEQTGSDEIQFDSDGFTFLSGDADSNTSGYNYIYMAFADTRDATFFGDTSGNSNNWTPNALNNTDVVPDSPVTNFASLNPLDKVGVSLSEGNLKSTATASSWQAVRSTVTYPSGSWYAEVRSDAGTGNGNSFVGITRVSDALSTMTGSNHIGTSSTAWAYSSNGNIYNSNAVDTATGTTWSAGAIIGVAFDGSSVKFYKDNTLVHTESSLTGDYVLTLGAYSTDAMTANFGQDSSFAGNETPQGNADDNGQGDFYYAPPSGFLAMNRNNLPTPDILDPTDYFNTVLWNATGTQSITGVGFQPDWLWLKVRSTSGSHHLMDSVRGAANFLQSDTTDSETNSPTFLTSFDSDGFSFGSNNWSDSRSMVGWNWLAGGTAVSNTDGSITSSVSANTDAGFSIVSWNASSTSATIGHGLGVRPDLVIMKTRDSAIGWPVQCSALGDMTSSYLFLNTTTAKLTGTTWSDATATTFGTSSSIVKSGDDYIAYCFNNVEGYSKIGSYTGNGSTDGTYVHLGFRPSLLLLKDTDTAYNWILTDSTRNTSNIPASWDWLYPNLSSAENSPSVFVDYLSNGFKLRSSGADVNGSGSKMIFMAFAEAPFKNANAR